MPIAMNSLAQAINGRSRLNIQEGRCVPSRGLRLPVLPRPALSPTLGSVSILWACLLGDAPEMVTFSFPFGFYFFSNPQKGHPWKAGPELALLVGTWDHVTPLLTFIEESKVTISCNKLMRFHDSSVIGLSHAAQTQGTKHSEARGVSQNAPFLDGPFLSQGRIFSKTPSNSENHVCVFFHVSLFHFCINSSKPKAATPKRRA